MINCHKDKCSYSILLNKNKKSHWYLNHFWHNSLAKHPPSSIFFVSWHAEKPPTWVVIKVNVYKKITTINQPDPGLLEQQLQQQRQQQQVIYKSHKYHYIGWMQQPQPKILADETFLKLWSKRWPDHNMPFMTVDLSS